MFTDEHDIERELKAALRVQPSSAFESRVLAAAADQQHEKRRSLWPWVGVAAALVIAVSGWLVGGRAQGPSPNHVVAGGNRSAAEEPPRPQSGRGGGLAPAPARSPEAAPRPARPRRAVLDVARLAPEVVVPANQLTMIAAFAREIQGGRVRLAAEADAEAETVLRTLVVPEMTVDPIPIVALEAGGPAAKGLQ